MRTLNEYAIEYDSGRLFRDELGYAEVVWGPDIARRRGLEQAELMAGER